MTNFKHVYLAVVTMVVLAMGPAQAQTYLDIHDFTEADGCCQLNPGLLAQGLDGNIYGATQNGGKFGLGVIFMMTPTGQYTDIHDMASTEGYYPQSGLSLGWDGFFYGTTYLGGSGKVGTVFKVSPEGALTVLYNFMNGTDGAYPRTPPVQAPDGNLYGATANSTVATLYKLTPAGAFSVVLNLPSQSYSPLIVGTDGNLYGTTVYGGAFNSGCIFQFAPTKKKNNFKIIYSFHTEGYSPFGPLMQGADGFLYGTASVGGTSSVGVVFKVSTAGKYTVLYNFSSTNPTNGSTPLAGVVQGSDGYLYGVTTTGGVNGQGVLFKVSTKGKGFAVLHNFATATGDSPLSTPMLHTNGMIYGLTEHGGSHTAYGAMYSLDAGLKPFVSPFVFFSGKVGSFGGILGQGFSNATGVKFGAGVGTFVSSADTFMTATVDTGATTGVITVEEPGGNLSTPLVFDVIPAIVSYSPKSGAVGTKVTITGTSLLQTSSVTIGKVKAVFTVNSDTQVTATVGADAVTGTVTLKTPGGMATGAGKFTVN